MQYYSYITGDPEILEIYKRVVELENEDREATHHSIDHVKKASEMAGQLLSGVGADETLVEEGKIAGYLHDVGRIKGKKQHAESSYEMVKKYFNDRNIHPAHEEMLLEAIRSHTDGFEVKTPLAVTLILADKLNITEQRLAERGYFEPGTRQMEHIKDTEIEFDGDTMHIYFICDEGLDREELERDFAFLAKVYRAIESFADFFGLKYTVEYKVP